MSDARPPSMFRDQSGESWHEPAPDEPGHGDDARPPSASVASVSLGWHTHGENSAWRDGERDCATVAGPSRPVIVVDPAQARETIAAPIALARCQDVHANDTGNACRACQSFAQVVALRVLAALGSQVQP